MTDEKKEPNEKKDPASEPKQEEQKTKVPEASFAQLIVLLGTQAMQQLGMITNPLSGKKEVDLSIAKFSIDLLGVLQDKTKSNRTKEEDQILEDLLFDLRLRYVELVKKNSSSKPDEKTNPES